ncbi:hypothetical protein BKD30_09970 [Tersicoccus phoenicis]|uniref:Phage holin family protein n=1 Tax=Tersicoccus phoenicis TaxID=554083 RepID=A0A1R1L9H5_9MICC|nr:phage holin family protein [Tersicoccus phoenicis]OMH24194.1 hypothetical protein BKD30_09970 [Tersicoccus phoenicis]
MSQQTTTRTGNSRSLGGMTTVMSRLVPKQLADEVNLALLEMKAKGIQVGVAAAFFVVGLVFAAFLVVMLLVALVSGIANWFSWDYWLAALVVGAVFLVILVIAALIGLSRLKKAMPLKPEQAIRGLKYDLGVLKEGRGFDERTLTAQKTPEQQAEDERKKQAKQREKAANPPATESELQTRTGQRRAHLANLRDDLGRKADVKKRWRAFSGRAVARAESFSDDVATRLHAGPGTVDGTGAHAATARPAAAPRGAGEPAETLRERWVPLSVFAVSSGAFAVFVRKLVKKL